MSCWVMVEPPCVEPLVKLATSAPTIRLDVYAVVLVKTRVFHGDEGILKHFRNLVDGDHDAVFRTLVIGDEVPFAVVYEGSFILSIQRGQIERWRGIDKRLGDADDGAQQRQPHAQGDDEGQANGGRGNAEHEIRLLVRALKMERARG